MADAAALNVQADAAARNNAGTYALSPPISSSYNCFSRLRARSCADSALSSKAFNSGVM